MALLAGRREIAQIWRFATTLTHPQRRRLGLPLRSERTVKKTAITTIESRYYLSNAVLELGHVAVEVEAVDRFQIEGDVVLEEIANIGRKVHADTITEARKNAKRSDSSSASNRPSLQTVVPPGPRSSV
jgi:hypothetical protein